MTCGPECNPAVCEYLQQHFGPKHAASICKMMRDRNYPLDKEPDKLVSRLAFELGNENEAGEMEEASWFSDCPRDEKGRCKAGTGQGAGRSIVKGGGQLARGIGLAGRGLLKRAHNAAKRRWPLTDEELNYVRPVKAKKPGLLKRAHNAAKRRWPLTDEELNYVRPGRSS